MCDHLHILSEFMRVPYHSDATNALIADDATITYILERPNEQGSIEMLNKENNDKFIQENHINISKKRNIHNVTMNKVGPNLYSFKMDHDMSVENHPLLTNNGWYHAITNGYIQLNDNNLVTYALFISNAITKI